jgi:hypothetical protein
LYTGTTMVTFSMNAPPNGDFVSPVVHWTFRL